MKPLRFAWTLAPLLALAGCVAFGGVEQIGPDTYRIGVEATTNTDDAALAERAALDAAASFCDAQGRRITRTVSETDSVAIATADGALAHSDSTLTFRCR
jgi:hypothetical protein